MEFDWTKKHVLKINDKIRCFNDFREEFEIDEKENIEKAYFKCRDEIEPWLSAIFQSEHLSLLIGSGLTTGVSELAKVNSKGMGRISFKTDDGNKIKEFSDKSSVKLARGEANFEDDLRAAFDLLNGYAVLDETKKHNLLHAEIMKNLENLLLEILSTEREFLVKLLKPDELAIKAFDYLKSFLFSFASRAASRDRLNIFTTNYDRFIEFACDEAGILLIDRFKGKLNPILRHTRLELDYHYNPPGIRGEPRYVEGVARMSKLHGSIDWRFQNERIKRALLPFGAPNDHSDALNVNDTIVIFPSSSKAIETTFSPYSELFRDLSAAISRPNSSLVVYGYGFGDSHINTIIEDMLTIPSTHLVIMSFDKLNGNSMSPVRKRIEKFTRGKLSQITLLIGDNLGALNYLVDYYLPKAAIDRITYIKNNLVRSRITSTPNSTDSEKTSPSI